LAHFAISENGSFSVILLLDEGPVWVPGSVLRWPWSRVGSAASIGVFERRGRS